MAQSLRNYIRLYLHNHSDNYCIFVVAVVDAVEDIETFVVVVVDYIDLDIVSVVVASDYIQGYNYFMYLAFVDSFDSYSLHSHNYHIDFHLDSGLGIVAEAVVADMVVVVGSEMVPDFDMAVGSDIVVAVVAGSDIEAVAVVVVAVAAEAVVVAS